MNKKVYIFLGDGFEEIEALTPVDILRRAGLEVVMVSTTTNIMVTGGKNICVKADALFEQLDYSDADLILLPGGPGTDALNAHIALKQIVKTHVLAGKMTAAICAAPKILGSMSLLDGKNATCYPGVEKFLGAAHFIPAPVVEDGIFITANGVGAALEFSLLLVKRLVSEELAKELAGKVMAK
jgi:4-methyl-5(b-hydroxyethyl)-thiazole monophosphate biosynthesis